MNSARFRKKQRDGDEKKGTKQAEYSYLKTFTQTNF